MAKEKKSQLMSFFMATLSVMNYEPSVPLVLKNVHFRLPTVV